MLPAYTITLAMTSVATPLAVSPEEGAEPGLAAVQTLACPIGAAPAGAPAAGPGPPDPAVLAAPRPRSR